MKNESMSSRYCTNRPFTSSDTVEKSMRRQATVCRESADNLSSASTPRSRRKNGQEHQGDHRLLRRQRGANRRRRIRRVPASSSCGARRGADVSSTTAASRAARPSARPRIAARGTPVGCRGPSRARGGRPPRDWVRAVSSSGKIGSSALQFPLGPWHK